MSIITISAKEDIAGALHSVCDVFEFAKAHPGGQMAFGIMKGPRFQSLGVDQGALIPFCPHSQGARAIGLITCASICFVDQNLGVGYVFHANAGVLKRVDYLNAIRQMGSSPAKVKILYAHPGLSDPSYQETLLEMHGWGTPEDQIVEIEKLFIAQFGMNHLSEVGY